MKKNVNKNKVMLLLIIFSFVFTFNTNNVFAQNADDKEEYIEEEDNVADESVENGDEEVEEDTDESEDAADDEISDEEFEEGYGSEELYANEEGLDDPNGMYKLDDIAASTFQQISNIERENALMKLKIEQGKLKLDLEKQKAEKKKITAGVEEDARQRKIKQQEQKRKLAEEIKKQKQQEEKEEEERKKKSRDAEINQKLLDKLNSADFSNPEDVKALTALMSLSTGKPLDKALGSGNMQKEETLEDKYSVKSIMGAGGNMVATIENIAKKSTFKVKVGSIIDQWLVADIRGTSVLLKKGSEIKVMNLN